MLFLLDDYKIKKRRFISCFSKRNLHEYLLYISYIISSLNKLQFRDICFKAWHFKKFEFSGSERVPGLLKNLFSSLNFNFWSIILPYELSSKRMKIESEYIFQVLKFFWNFSIFLAGFMNICKKISFRNHLTLLHSMQRKFIYQENI